MTTSDVVQELKKMFPSVKFYNGTINKNDKQCVGVYGFYKGTPARKALGNNGSYNTFPVSILLHWTENTETCEAKANEMYQTLFDTEGLMIAGKRVISLDLSTPEKVGRDDSNIVEMVIRLNIIHER